MIKATLQRFSQDKVTFGKLHLEGIDHPDIYTIELPWKDNYPNISCIPAGLYSCIPHESEKYPNTYEVTFVPGRTAILIHSGNFACEVNLSNAHYNSDTRGCIIVGFGIQEETPMVTRSKAALKYLQETFGKKNFSLEVKNP
jgi:hypothetical protein